MGVPTRIVLIAGEASGDQLGAALVPALESALPGVRCAGIGGPRLRDTGFEAWWDSEELAVMGLSEVLRHLPRLLRLRRALRERILDWRPDLVIGIDAPDFNLGLERQLKSRGLRTAHYVSPTVWAWRPGRARKIARSADLVLCLFPFEPGFYAEHGVNARYTGHPMADRIPLDNDPVAARSRLGLATDGPIVALLPGSRGSEVERLATPMLDAARRLHQAAPGTRFLVPLAGESAAQRFRDAMTGFTELDCRLLDGQSLDAMAAADVVVCASGTATLECMLVGRPMVSVYRLAPSTYHLARTLKLMKIQHFALPNILAGKALVPELLQDEATGENIAREVTRWMEDDERHHAVLDQFRTLHESLRIDAAASAAKAIRELLQAGTMPA